MVVRLAQVLTVLSMTVLFAGGAWAEGEARDNISTCRQLSELAGTVMAIRQEGGEMAEVLGLLEDSGQLNGVLGTFMVGVVQAAFEVPKFSTDRYKQEQVTEFSNVFMRVCLENL